MVYITNIYDIGSYVLKKPQLKIEKLMFNFLVHACRQKGCCSYNPQQQPLPPKKN